MRRHPRLIPAVVIASVVVVVGLVISVILYDMHVINTIDERCLEYYGYNRAQDDAAREAAAKAAREACGTVVP